MPKQKPGKSKQNYGTPPEFLAAVKKLLGIDKFKLDVAASADNAVSAIYYDEAHDALKDEHSWDVDGWSWLNPPYSNLEPWTRKACFEAANGAKIAILLPASVGSNWWRNWVNGKAVVLFLNGRLTFVGEKAPYPKDSALLLYWGGVTPALARYSVWDWKKGEIY